MNIQHKRKQVLSHIDDEQCWYVLQNKNSQEVVSPSTTISSPLIFSHDDLQLAGLGMFRVLADSIPQEGHPRTKNNSKILNVLILPSQYTKSVLNMVEQFVLKHTNHQTKRRKITTHNIFSTPNLLEMFQDRTLDELYLLLTFAHEYDAKQLANTGATWLLKHKGLETLCANIPTGSTATAVGLEMANVIDEEQKLQLLQLKSNADCGAFFWLAIIQCAGFHLYYCTDEQKEQKQRLWMKILQYDEYLRGINHAKGVQFLDCYQRSAAHTTLPL
jgi:hypothetical protein